MSNSQKMRKLDLGVNISVRIWKSRLCYVLIEDALSSSSSSSSAAAVGAAAAAVIYNVPVTELKLEHRGITTVSLIKYHN